MNRFLFAFEIVGTIAFAASGAMTGLKKNMDIFGVCILGLTTALGGGIIRDLILGNTPPNTFWDPTYVLLALCTSLFFFLQAVRKKLLMLSPKWHEQGMRLMDSLGLGAFTVVGIDVAYEHVAAPSLSLLIFVGVITGVGGGVLRDLLAGDTPYIFVKHVYASASLAGALVCAGLWNYAGHMTAMSVGAALVIIIRLLSAHYRWNLPKANM